MGNRTKCAKCGKPCSSMVIVKRGNGKYGNLYHYERYLHWKHNGASWAKRLLIPKLRQIERILEAEENPEGKVPKALNLIKLQILNVSLNARRKYCYVKVPV